MDGFADDREHVFLRDVFDDRCAHFAAALDERDNGRFPQHLRGAIPFAADVRFVNLDGAVQLFCIFRARIHRVANPMRHEPRRLVRKLEHPVQLVGRNAFLAGAQNEHGHYPLGNRNVAGLKNRPNCHRELLPAGRAAIQPLPHLARFNPRGHDRFRRQLVNIIALAVRAIRAIGPAQGFQQLAGFALVAVILSQLNQIQLFGIKFNLLHDMRITQQVGLL